MRFHSWPLGLLLGLTTHLYALASRAEESNEKAHSMPTQQLVDCLKSNSTCEIDWWDARDELAKRNETNLLFRTYRASQDELQKDRIVQVLYDIHDPKVEQFMRSIATKNTEERDWFALNYLARKSDRRALAILNGNCGKYGIPSDMWGDTLKLFGKYRYRPAIPCLIEWVNAASLNAAEDAYESLQLLFPGSPPDLASPEEAQRYFRKRFAEESPSPKKDQLPANTGQKPK